jgi:RNA polymerase sigma-70 factor (ECF subfamily)
MLGLGEICNVPLILSVVPHMTDEDCIRLCLDGRPEMFRQLVIRYESALIKHLAGRLGDENEAAEAAQETMVRSYFALPRLKKAGSFFPWLLGIADRVAREVHRARRRHPASLDFEAVSALPQPDHAMPDGQLGPELGQAVAELPEVYKQVILMRFYGGQSCAEISRNLGISLGTVTSRLSRAYALLREALPTHQHNLEMKP